MDPDFSGHRASSKTQVFALALIRVSRASSRIEHAILATLHAPTRARSTPRILHLPSSGHSERLKTDRSAEWGARVGIFAVTAAGRTRRVGLGSDGGRGGGHERPGVYLGVDKVRRELSHGKDSAKRKTSDERTGGVRRAKRGQNVS